MNRPWVVVLRYVAGVAVALAFSAVYRTGFYYSPPQFNLTAQFIGLAVLFGPYAARATGRPSWRMLRWSLGATAVLYIIFGFKYDSEYVANVRYDWVIFLPEAVQLMLSMFGFLFVGVAVVALLLPQRPARRSGTG